MTVSELRDVETGAASPVARLHAIWAAVGVAGWLAALLLTWDPSVDAFDAALLALLPFVVLLAMITSFAEVRLLIPPGVAVGALATTLVGWAVLALNDDQWTLLTFGLFALCFTKGRVIGVVLAAFVAAVWLAAWIDDDAPTWRLLVPLAAFAVGAIFAATIHRVNDENTAQAALIAELKSTQRELAASERERGTLEERARFAGEIHDTLAQGFTSIVLLSRATHRNEEWQSGLDSIEEIAAESLQAARRLVAAMKPPELDALALPDAIERQVSQSLEPHVTAHFSVTGTPTQLATAVEVALLRAAQEALLNVRTHAKANEVHVTLTYFDREVALDVQDDGVGLSSGSAADRGSLTGGQGLIAMRHRSETLGGQVSLEARQSGGTIVSVRLPIGTP